MNTKNTLSLLGYLIATQMMRSEHSFTRNSASIDVSGEWDTNWGKMVLNQKGNIVSGRYTWENGKIEGTLTGTLLKGQWSEAPSYDCPKDKGFMELEFSPEGLTFAGKWSYCDEPAISAWTGTKVEVGSDKSIGIDVTGSWGIYDGIMVLEQENSSVQGRYQGIDFLGSENRGIILGTISQDPDSELFMFEGTWSSPPTFACPEDKGTLKMTFNSDKNQFIMNWGYCIEPVSETNTVQGDLIVGPDPLDIAGIWDTNVGPMTFRQEGSVVEADYKDNRARLEGKIVGNVLVGDWFESNTYSCPFQKGRYQMIFTPDSKSFRATWGYCKDNPDPTKVWIGNRL